MHYTSKTEDSQNKGEVKGLMGHAAGEPMAISEWTSTVFASLEATLFQSTSTWPENILLVQNSGSMFQLVCIPSSFPSQEILLAWKKGGGEFRLPERPWDFHPKKGQMHKQATRPGGE